MSWKEGIWMSGDADFCMNWKIGESHIDCGYRFSCLGLVDYRRCQAYSAARGGPKRMYLGG